MVIKLSQGWKIASKNLCLGFLKKPENVKSPYLRLLSFGVFSCEFYTDHILIVIWEFCYITENDVTWRMAYEMFFLDRNCG